MPTEWWLRPVRNAWRVGEHRAVVWKRVSFSPPAANFSAVGVWHGPPKALVAPKPTSSIRAIEDVGETSPWVAAVAQSERTSTLKYLRQT